MIRTGLTIFSGVMLCLMLADHPKAEPLVLHDNGRAISIEPYLEKMKADIAPPQQDLGPPRLPAAGFGLPVSTPSMTPGKVHPRSLSMLRGKMAGGRPLFLIGADRWSLSWLQQHRARLLDLKAVGMVVSVTSASDLEILRQAAGSLPLMPASGEVMAQKLGLKHYPVLIAPPGVIDQ